MSRILVVEDEFPIRLGLQYLLEDAGYEVALARNAHEALELLTRSSYDLAVVDLRMHDETGRLDEDAGIELLRQMETQYATLPAIALTVRDDQEAIHACQQLSNIKEHVVKDPNPVRLKGLVEKLLSSASPQSGQGGTHTTCDARAWPQGRALLAYDESGLRDE
jgi:CheY-like chemotaxis protein